MGRGEGRGEDEEEEEAEEKLEGDLYTMAMAEHGREFAVGSSGALCHHRSHQYCQYCLLRSLLWITAFVILSTF